jgi:DNA-binding CsgD family transcriptional regulator
MDVFLSKLNKKEQDILALWTCGQTVKDIARCLKISPRAVNYHRAKIRIAFGASVSAEVIHRVVLMDGYEALVLTGRALILQLKKFPNNPNNLSIV